MKSILHFIIINLMILHKGVGVQVSLWAATTNVVGAPVDVLLTAKQ